MNALYKEPQVRPDNIIDSMQFGLYNNMIGGIEVSQIS